MTAIEKIIKMRDEALLVENYVLAHLCGVAVGSAQAVLSEDAYQETYGDLGLRAVEKDAIMGVLSQKDALDYCLGMHEIYDDVTP